VSLPARVERGPGCTGIASLIVNAWFQARLECHGPFVYPLTAFAESITCFDGCGDGTGVLLTASRCRCLSKQTEALHCNILHNKSVRQDAAIVGLLTGQGAHLKMVGEVTWLGVQRIRDAQR
jgi:hypothetical protein